MAPRTGTIILREKKKEEEKTSEGIEPASANAFLVLMQAVGDESLSPMTGRNGKATTAGSVTSQSRIDQQHGQSYNHPVQTGIEPITPTCPTPPPLPLPRPP